MRHTSDLLPEKGFTLIELMIAVFIVAVLAMIAIPSYQSHIRKSRRMDAVTSLLHMQLLESRYRATNSTYGTLAQIGAASSSDYYSYTVTNVSATAYTLTATAKSGTTQTSDAENGTSCSPLTLNQDNTKSPTVCWPS